MYPATFNVDVIGFYLTTFMPRCSRRWPCGRTEMWPADDDLVA